MIDSFPVAQASALKRGQVQISYSHANNNHSPKKGFSNAVEKWAALKTDPLKKQMATSDHFTFLGNCPPTPFLSHQQNLLLT